ncbi:MAG: pantoate--beta-alanine ligase [Myxococcales bacterium]|nr:pantoate--beta-alanine ligase [Myxococcales bacterium]
MRDPAAMRARAAAVRAAGGRIAFVPTMGFLHEGHLSLLREGRRRGELLVLSIFVNPLQFGPAEDLARYPRDEQGDLDKARSVGCDVAFCPSVEAMYPPGFQTRVEVPGLAAGLCGQVRPGHFAGVATVVLKLCHIVQPHVLLLGEKDYQQLQIVRRMVADLDLDIEVVGCPLVREPDGLALSSRNAYLSPQERQQALALSRGLRAAEQRYRAGERRAEELLAAARQELIGAPGVVLQYLELRDAATLEPVAGELDRAAVLAVAALVGQTRLIDNVILR